MTGGWGRRGRGLIVHEERLMAEINVTPLTDVMLVLLVIFMVTTPLFVMESFKLKLPKAISGTSEPGSPVVLAITIDGIHYVNGRRMGDSSELFETLKKEFKNSDAPGVLIKADAGTRHGLVVEALDIAKQAGAEKLSIATEPEAGS